jgi:hypothetical protein
MNCEKSRMPLNIQAVTIREPYWRREGRRESAICDGQETALNA